ncbi:MAG TPA: hypothetical protein VEK38_02990 [Candidatus Bathyarchaeia archaeon]|nr:hypothetical protein [Candidatus Bathyarchaeia archaeon]
MKKNLIFYVLFFSSLTATEKPSPHAIIILATHSFGRLPSIFERMTKRNNTVGISINAFTQQLSTLVGGNSLDQFKLQNNIPLKPLSGDTLFAYYIRTIVDKTETEKLRNNDTKPTAYVVGHVISCPTAMNTLLQQLEPYKDKTYFMNVFCNFETAQKQLEEHNANKDNDRTYQYNLVELQFGKYKAPHNNQPVLASVYTTQNAHLYDLEIDTTNITPEKSELAIWKHYVYNEPSAFAQNYTINHEEKFEAIKKKFLEDKK